MEEEGKLADCWCGRGCGCIAVWPCSSLESNNSKLSSSSLKPNEKLVGDETEEEEYSLGEKISGGMVEPILAMERELAEGQNRFGDGSKPSVS